MGCCMKRLLGLLGLVVLFASRSAAAQEHEADEPKAEERERHWYGWQTLATDGVSFTMMGLGVGSIIHETTSYRSTDNHTTSGFLIATGAAGYLFAAPTVHALHGHWGKAGASLALRGGPLVLGTGIIAAGGNKAGALGGGVIFLGVLAALIVDSAVVANEDVVPAPRTAIAPTYDPKSRAGGLSFAAEF